MNREQLLNELDNFYSACINLVKLKNQDYAGKDDPFRNLRLCEMIGVCSTECGIAIRLSDKMARVGNLLKKDAAVTSESLRDTLMDMANYAALLAIWLGEKNEQG